MSEKELSDDLIHAIKWVATEYYYLEELKDVLDEFKDEPEIKKKDKEFMKILHLFKYFARAEKRVANLEGDLQKSFDEICTELLKHTKIDLSIKQEWITEIRQIMKEMEVYEKYLVEFASFYEGSLRNNLDEVKEDIKKEKSQRGLLMMRSFSKNDEETKKTEAIHAGLILLIDKIKNKIVTAEQWISAMEALLKKAHETLDKLPKDKYTILQRYFNNRKLNKKELEEIYQYRKECIHYVTTKPEAGSFKNTTFFGTVDKDLSDSKLERLFGYRTWIDKDKDLDKEKQRLFKGKTVIDLGSGGRPGRISAKLIELGVKKYIGVDLFWSHPGKFSNGEIIKEDALTYLLKLKDSSVLVISYGYLLLNEVLPGGQKGYDYLRFLIREIARVTPKGGITFLAACSEEVGEILKNNGFILRNQSDTDFFAIKR